MDMSALGSHTAMTGGNGVETRLTDDSVVSGEWYVGLLLAL